MLKETTAGKLGNYVLEFERRVKPASSMASATMLLSGAVTPVTKRRCAGMSSFDLVALSSRAAKIARNGRLFSRSRMLSSAVVRSARTSPVVTRCNPEPRRCLSRPSEASLGRASVDRWWSGRCRSPWTPGGV